MICGCFFFFIFIYKRRVCLSVYNLLAACVSRRRTPRWIEVRATVHVRAKVNVLNESGRGAETAYAVCTSKMPCSMEGKRPRASEWQIAEQVSALFLLKSVISALSILGQTFCWSRERMEADGGSMLLSRLVFRWTRDQERMATHYSEDLQRTTAGIGCRNRHLKSAPTGHCHTSDGAQTTRTFFFVEGTHVHWQATAEQFFFSEFNIMFK